MCEIWPVGLSWQSPDADDFQGHLPWPSCLPVLDRTKGSMENSGPGHRASHRLCLLVEKVLE